MYQPEATTPFYARTTPSQARSPLLYLLLVGPLLAIASFVALFVVKGAAEDAARQQSAIDSFKNALEGLAGGGTAAAPDYTWVWIFGALSFVGLLMFVAAITVQAARR